MRRKYNMQKKLITAAVGAALASAAFMAQADVTVYGRAQFEWAQVTNDGVYNFGTFSSGNIGSWNNAVVAPGTTRSAAVDNKMGRFGIKADEDLGGGWKGVANFEWQVDTADSQDNASGPITERVTYVGISQKSIGTLYFGQDHSPYKLSGVPLDPFIATTLEARNNNGMSGNRDGWGVMNGHNGFVDNGAFFKSASWAGVYVNAYIGLDRTGTDGTCGVGSTWGNCDAPANGGKNNGDLSATVGWKGDLGPVGLSVFGSYASMVNTTNNAAGTGDPTAMKLGAQLTFAKAHTISMQYEMTDRNNLANNDLDEGTYLFLGYQGKFGPVTAVAQWGGFESGSAPTGSKYDGNYYALGAIYNMSKTFRIFGGYRHSDNSLNTGIQNYRDDDVISLGMRKDF
jgi:predicted porin